MTATMTEHVQEQLLGAVRKGQEMTLDTIKKFVEAVSAAQAKLPAAPFDSKLHALPFAGRLPERPALLEPEAVVSSAFDFLEQFLADQRKFADELIKVTAALRPADDGKPAGAEDAGAEDAGHMPGEASAQPEGGAE